MESTWDTSILAEYFEYDIYSGAAPKEGWLLNYQIRDKVCPETSKLTAYSILYFVDTENKNFRIEMPFSPKILLEVSETAITGVEEYLQSKYQSAIKSTHTVKRLDLQKDDHLTTDASVYLSLNMHSEQDVQQIRKELEETVKKNKIKKKEKAATFLFVKDKKYCTEVSPDEAILNIYEYDIPPVVQMPVELDINAGKWYTVNYKGGEYTVAGSERVIPPDLRIFSFDIETTKDPLKFPTAEKDKIMMISIMSSIGGWLIVNREIVSEDIQPFEFRPTEDIGGDFDIHNEKNEEHLLSRFMEIIHVFKPHVVTTYNGDYFDWPFVDARMKVHGMNLHTSLGFANNARDEYVSDCILHLDCYKWVKRDSYLPAGSQGLKSVTRAKLGYFPDEIDPENMVRFADTKPKLLASYSVSDAIATHFLYIKYVHPFIFSLASLIPMPPDDVLRKGSGTLCETLLIKEAYSCDVLIPAKKRTQLLYNYNGRMAESLSYVGGHVECLKSGIFRSDFEYEFSFNGPYIENMIRDTEHVVNSLIDGEICENKEAVVQEIQEKLRALAGMEKGSFKPQIYHLDVGAMYPNIILTNRLQPSAITDDRRCGKCSYFSERNTCQRKLHWKGRAEVYPIDEKTVASLQQKTAQEYFKKNKTKDFENDSENRKKKEGFVSYEHKLRDALIEYAKKTSRRTREVVIEDKQSMICQRENPFYVNAVRKFRDRRNEYKALAKKARSTAQQAQEAERVDLNKKAAIYDSLQIAHKCVLNSFYGYVMKKGARWHSMEMAAVVCQTGSHIIQRTKAVIDAFGITLELDTDGIWVLLPEQFPLNYTLKTESGSISFSYICALLNCMLLDAFSNNQYQEKNEKGGYDVRTENSIQFEIDGPYRAMFLPGSTKEGESIKKRYIVINSKNKISELKGFEFKRRGELKFIKSFQEEMFNSMLAGSTLSECYEALAECADYWLDIIETKAEALAQDEIFNYFGETRNMSKSAEEYSVAKSTCLTAAERLSELLGQNVVVKGMCCSFIVSKYPENEPVTSRAIPQSVFQAEKESRDKYLQKWMRMKVVPDDIRDIIDWEYYLERLSNIIARIIIVPAALQGLANPVRRVQAPEWATGHKKILGFLKKKQPAEIAHGTGLDQKNGNDAIESSIENTIGSEIDKNDKENRIVKNSSSKKEQEKEPRTKQKQKLLDYLSVKNLKIKEEAKESTDTAGKEKSKNENLAVCITSIGQSSFTAVYLAENGEFAEKITPIKKVFYIQADESVLEAILNTYSTAQTSIQVEKVRKTAVGMLGEREFIRIEVDSDTFASKFHNYTDLFESPEVKSIHELDIPSGIRALQMVQFKKVPVYTITACTSEGKTLYAVHNTSMMSLFSEKTFDKNSEGVSFFESTEALLAFLDEKDAGVLFHTKSPILASLKTKHYLSPLSILSSKTIQGISVAASLLFSTLHKASKRVAVLINTAEYSNTPILAENIANGNTLLLDHLHYKERTAKNIIGWNNSKTERQMHYTLTTEDENPFSKQFYKEGVYEGISVGVSFSGTILLSIIEADTLMKEERASVKQGVEMEALQSFIKAIVYGCIKNQKGAINIANAIPHWLRSPHGNTSITEFIKGRVALLQIKFISGIVAAINRTGSDVILVDGEDAIIHTRQPSKALAEVHIDNVIKEVSGLSYGSLIRMRTGIWYNRILMIDQANYHKSLVCGKVQSLFMFPVPSEIITSLLQGDDLPALEYLKDTYMNSTQNGLTLARVLIKANSLKGRAPNFTRKAASIVQISPFSSEISREFGSFTTLSLECVCSATASVHSSVETLARIKSEIEVFFNGLVQNSQSMGMQKGIKCGKCMALFARADVEGALMEQIYASVRKAVKMERKCTVCKKPSAGTIVKRCACGGMYSRDRKKDFKEAIDSVLSLCLIAPTISIIIYAREMVQYLSIYNE
ncbi:DNA polymerase epsilon subunit 1 [Nematocida minor]|uniref:DNA polymerase epsilon subunit 1 n=1 Tax=Nematocida minor TaxID=1912983 RepID=UPI0022209A01|nr:DNA polymerase epsilon subunit 1 [Nematocida minor]KAI5191593.1 DNA polymerase epsilon subunit 1 [Nematocida minor]